MSNNKYHRIKPRCYLEVSINDKIEGQIIVELFDNIVPKTCQNFISLCTGENDKKMSYLNCPFHRVIKDFMIQTGDFENGDGTGGQSIYGKIFNDENLSLKHDRPYLFSMANCGKNTNGSQFFITTVPTTHLDGIHVVFGHVITGEDLIRKIENTSTDDDDVPCKKIVISDCGQLIAKPKKKTNRYSKSVSRSVSKSEEESPVDDGSTLKFDEIPSIPENKFLKRIDIRDDVRHNSSRHYRQNRRDKDGVKIRGRGPVCYDKRERSVTPPHWRNDVKSCDRRQDNRHGRFMGRDVSPLRDNSYKTFTRRTNNRHDGRNSKSRSRSRSSSEPRRRNVDRYISPLRDDSYKSFTRNVKRISPSIEK
ncbi:Cyclophilin-9 [Intoshia linei]|uniref:Peptidyl-prolyl cis-trans isomerase, rhodopsin-specific isozyme n=1 Tax=Intoshia linei TaxID=1819745 RepID=A0A177BAS9_9BILA|nr:Cyclophilin-9 [Intoshia linei]